MQVPEFLIERLKEQIALAPEGVENDEPGGTVPGMILRLEESIGTASKIPALRGSALSDSLIKAYRFHLSEALVACKQLAEAFATGRPTQAAIVMPCNVAIIALENAQKILDNGGRIQAGSGV